MSKIVKDALGNRMKKYESIFKNKLIDKTYSIMRLDGKAFHTYAKGLVRPFDDGLIQDMDETAAYLCKNIMGAKMAFVQSDEITIVIGDFSNPMAQSWFDNDIQKMVSVSASMATAKFNQLRLARLCESRVAEYVKTEDISNFKLAEFDSRVFQVPSRVEVLNNLIWRQQDTVRNSISSVAQSLYSHKELDGKKSNDMQEMIFQKGTNWNDYPASLKRGRLITKVEYELECGAKRNKWVSEGSPDFLKDRVLFDKILETNPY